MLKQGLRSFFSGDGCIDLSYNRDLTADEFEVFTMLLLSLNRKKYPLKILKLDSCDITGNLILNRSSNPKNLTQKFLHWNIMMYLYI